MPKWRVFVTRVIPDEGLNLILENCDAEVWREETPPSREIIIEKIKDCEGILVLLTDKIDAEIMDNAPKLRIISNYAVGYDNIDVKSATQRGILVTNTPGVLTETTADLAFALILATARRIVEADKFTRSGRWKSWGPMLFLGRDVYGATLGIIGLGRIGQAVARRAKGFNMRVIYFSRKRKVEVERELGVEYRELHSLLREADIVSIHTPLTEETYHLIGEKELSLMKPTAILVNTARGAVVDQKALYKALKERRIFGAGLDVYEKEPIDEDDPLMELENVILLPHIGSASVETRGRMARMAAENLLAGLRGEIPPNLVNPEVLRVK
ncbi:D-glycerate dehydrogenase [bacterium]|nr:D-glycerate dehydrogenase [bacterium]